MPSSPGTRQALVAAVVALSLLVAGVAVVLTTGRSDAAVRVAAVADVAPEIQPTTTTSPSTTTTTSTSTSTSTTTTLKPRPVVTAPRVTASTTPATLPPPTPPVVVTAEERCASARQWVAQQGLVLPGGWGFRCPSRAVVDGADRWGLACWNCEGTGSWIAVDIDRIGISLVTLRYVIAHEICHAVDYTLLGLSTEIGADLCAALHGAPRP